LQQRASKWFSSKAPCDGVADAAKMSPRSRRGAAPGNLHPRARRVTAWGHPAGFDAPSLRGESRSVVRTALQRAETFAGPQHGNARFTRRNGARYAGIVDAVRSGRSSERTDVLHTARIGEHHGPRGFRPRGVRMSVAF